MPRKAASPIVSKENIEPEAPIETTDAPVKPTKAAKSADISELTSSLAAVKIAPPARVRKVILGTSTVGTSPKRKTKERYEEMAEKASDPATAATMPIMDKLLHARRTMCTGLPVQFVKKTGMCLVCQKTTKWWCAGCHASFCMKISDDLDCDEFEMTLPGCSATVESRTISGVKNSCFLSAHMCALEKTNLFSA